MGTRGHREEGSPGTFQIRTESQRGRFDTRNPRRGFIGHFTNLHGATARALGRAGSLQRVHRALAKFARRRSEGALTRAILAEGSAGTLRICTAPQRERLGAQDHCRGFTGHLPNSHGVAARALYEFARRHNESAWARRIPAEGSSGSFKIRTASQRGRCGTRNPRRGFVGRFTNSHGATVGALRGARSLQRVHRAQHEHAKRGER